MESVILIPCTRLFKNRHAVARSAFPQPFIEPGAVNHVRLDLVRTEEYALAEGLMKWRSFTDERIESRGRSKRSNASVPSTPAHTGGWVEAPFFSRRTTSKPSRASSYAV